MPPACKGHDVDRRILAVADESMADADRSYPADAADRIHDAPAAAGRRPRS
jgi:hypothetical protein